MSFVNWAILSFLFFYLFAISLKKIYFSSYFSGASAPTLTPTATTAPAAVTALKSLENVGAGLLLPATLSTVPTVTYVTSTPFLPLLSQITAALTNKKDEIKFVVSTSATDHLPSFSSPVCAVSISGDSTIARYLVRNAGSEIRTLLGPTGPIGESLIDQWLDYYTLCVAGNGDLDGLPALLNTILAPKTFLVGDSLTLADISILVLLKKMKFTPVSPGTSTPFPHTNRWYSLVTFSLERTGVLPVLAGTGEKKYPPKGAGKVGGKVVKEECKQEAADGEGKRDEQTLLWFFVIVTMIKFKDDSSSPPVPYLLTCLHSSPYSTLFPSPISPSASTSDTLSYFLPSTPFSLSFSNFLPPPFIPPFSPPPALSSPIPHSPYPLSHTCLHT